MVALSGSGPNYCPGTGLRIYRGSRIQVKRQEGSREEFGGDQEAGNRVRRPDEEREKARG